MYLMFLGALVELLLLHHILCMYVPPVPWCPCRPCVLLMSSMLPVSWRPRTYASVHMFMPSTPELL